MVKPKMILFDYGHTLLYEPEYSTLRGTEAVMRYAVKNPHGITPEQINDFAAELHSKTHFQGREIGLEVPNLCFQRLLYEYLGIEFSIPPMQQEQIFFDACSPGAKMPYVEEMLDYLNGHEVGDTYSYKLIFVHI